MIPTTGLQLPDASSRLEDASELAILSWSCDVESEMIERRGMQSRNCQCKVGSSGDRAVPEYEPSRSVSLITKMGSQE